MSNAFSPSFRSDIDYALSSERAFTVIWAKGQTYGDENLGAVVERDGVSVSAAQAVALEEQQFYR